jgi:hypothetical protein
MRIGSLVAAGSALLIAVGMSVASIAGPAVDSDGDGVFNVLDNCVSLANKAPADCDTDNDGYGNRCDGDFDNNKLVTATDFGVSFLPDFKKGKDSGKGTDMDCNGLVTAADFGGSFLPQFKAGKPGPSGLFCAGTIPCDL